MPDREPHILARRLSRRRILAGLGTAFGAGLLTACLKENQQAGPATRITQQEPTNIPPSILTPEPSTPTQTIEDNTVVGEYRDWFPPEEQMLELGNWLFTIVYIKECCDPGPGLKYAIYAARVKNLSNETLNSQVLRDDFLFRARAQDAEYALEEVVYSNLNAKNQIEDPSYEPKLVPPGVSIEIEFRFYIPLTQEDYSFEFIDQKTGEILGKFNKKSLKFEGR